MKIGDLVKIRWGANIHRIGTIIAKRPADKIPEIDSKKNAKKTLAGINDGYIYVDGWTVLTEGELFNYSERILEVISENR